MQLASTIENISIEYMSVESDNAFSTVSDTIPLVNQIRMPFLESLIAEKAKEKISFHMPGHKGRCPSDPKVSELLNVGLYSADLVELNYNIDYLHAPKGALIEAQQLAAVAYGADHTFFLINGSTVGNIAAIMSVAAPGEKIIISRASHRSVYTALIMSGAIPIYIEPDYHSEIDFPLAVNVKAVETLLEQHPDAVAIHITSPNYYGVISDTAALCRLAHTHHVSLLVDEAHGSHLTFHPDLPKSAVYLGADIIIHSTHKTQGALTQAAMLHVNDNGFVNHMRVAQILALLQSSSPSSILLASLDAARMEMVIEGHERLQSVITRAEKMRNAIRQMNGLWCYGEELIGISNIFAFDPSKLIICVSDTGYTGLEVFKILQEQYGIDAEFADLKNIICSMTIADTEAHTDQLLNALYDFSKKQKRISITNTAPMRPPEGLPQMAISPRDAFLTKKTHVIPIDEAVGKILSGNVIPYPPGVPLLVSGEIMEKYHVDYIRYLISNGHDFVGTEDPLLNTIRVVCQ